MKYRKKPVEVEAVQWFPDPEFGGFLAGGIYSRYVNHKVGYDKLGVAYTITEVGMHTISGFATIAPGDWIITELDGVNHYPCNAAHFAATYEPVG